MARTRDLMSVEPGPYDRIELDGTVWKDWIGFGRNRSHVGVWKRETGVWWGGGGETGADETPADPLT